VPILGPRLFTLYLGELTSAIQHLGAVTYADDSYVILDGTSIEELQHKVSHHSKLHVEYLSEKGMIVNKSKTEVMVFGIHLIEADFDIDGTTIKSGGQMKMLGIIFQHNLEWNLHVESVLKRVKPKLSLLKKIAKNMNVEQFIKVATAQLFSIVYYASQVWLNKTLKGQYWTKLRSLHYRILRGAVKDFKQKRSKLSLDSQCKRATPKMWSDYSTSTMVMKLIRDGSPTYLSNVVKSTMYITRRKPTTPRFFDNSKGKIGLHRLSNQLNCMNGIEDWLGLNLGDDTIRIKLKKYFNFDFD